MATLSVNVPDALVPRLVAALQHRYPDLDGTAAQVGRGGVRRLLMETLAAAESRVAELAAYEEMVAAAELAKQQALADAGGIQ